MMKKDNFDITSVPKDGYLIFPLSMSRLPNAQSGQAIYDFLVWFGSKVRYISIDCIFLYTNDLYLNSDDKAIDIRKRTLDQMLAHKGEFMNILLKERQFIPQAFHFLPWDYSILNADDFKHAKEVLMLASKNDDGFKDCLTDTLKKQEREISDTNINFLIEENAVTHLLTYKKIPLPHTLASENGWRLICYPGEPHSSLIYMYKNNLLPKKSFVTNQENLYARSFYNMEKKILIDFDMTEVK